MTFSPTNIYTDRRFLTTAAYGSGANLAARQDIYRYQQPPVDLIGWALGQVSWSGGERVLDVGCGNGAYLRGLVPLAGPRGRVLGFDLSRGMLADVVELWNPALPRPLLAVADTQALPLPDASCDVALAMHMLYHVPDIGRAARELRRVLRPGGVLLAATNHDEHLRELRDAYHAAVATVGGGPVAEELRFSARFSLENGAEPLQGAFAQVERHDVSSALVIPEAAPVLRYIASARPGYQQALPAQVAWDDVMAALERIVTATIAAQGAFRVTTHAGLFACR